MPKIKTYVVYLVIVLKEKDDFLPMYKMSAHAHIVSFNVVSVITGDIHEALQRIIQHLHLYN